MGGSTACGTNSTSEDNDHQRQSIEGLQSRWQGDVGESYASEYVTNELGWTAEFFDKMDHGFDGVFRSPSGKLSIMESKLTTASGKSALGYPNIGREGSVDWVRYYAEQMCDRSSSYFTKDNAKIGEEILRVGPENVPFLIVHVNPSTLKTDETYLR